MCCSLLLLRPRRATDLVLLQQRSFPAPPPGPGRRPAPPACQRHCSSWPRVSSAPRPPSAGAAGPYGGWPAIARPWWPPASASRAPSLACRRHGERIASDGNRRVPRPGGVSKPPLFTPLRLGRQTERTRRRWLTFGWYEGIEGGDWPGCKSWLRSLGLALRSGGHGLIRGRVVDWMWHRARSMHRHSMATCNPCSSLSPAAGGPLIGWRSKTASQSLGVSIDWCDIIFDRCLKL